MGENGKEINGTAAHFIQNHMFKCWSLW